MIFLIYDNPINPQAINFVITKNGDDIKYLKISELNNSPYYRIPLSDLSSIILDNEIVYDLKSLIKFDESYLGREIYDYNTGLWLNDLNIIPINSFYKNRSLGEYINFIKRNFKQEFKYKNISDITEIIKTSAKLDGEVIVNNSKINKSFDHYTKTGRLHDITGNTIAMSRDKKSLTAFSGIKVEVDFDAFHLRLITDKLLGIQIPKAVKGYSWLKDRISFEGSMDDLKVAFFKDIYSERFELSSDPMFYRLKQISKNIQSPLGSITTNFNYVIQQFEIIEMSKFINSIPSDFVYNFSFYLYDGLVLDVKPSYIKDLFEILRSSKYPLKISVLGKKYFF